MKLSTLILTALLCANLRAAEPAAAAQSPEEKIRITSRDGFEYDLNARTAEYRGNVIVLDPAMKLTCEALTVKFAASGTNQTAKAQPMVANSLGGRVEMIEAVGRVVIVNLKDGSTAIGDKAVYTSSNETVVLSGGRPSITAGNGSGMRAPIIIFDRKAGKFRAEGQIESFFTQSAIEGGSLFNTTSQPPKSR
jgi:lipopolysaccharide export system protein LptA